jgi:hypothetical protein
VCVFKDLVEVQRRLAEVGGRNLVVVEAWEAGGDRGCVDRALGIDVRREAGEMVEPAGRRAPRRQIGRRRHPPLNDDVDVVRYSLVRDEEIAGSPAGDGCTAVVPETRVVVELEGEEGGGGARELRALAREAQVQERLCAA